jgi:hypothetical protein
MASGVTQKFNGSFVGAAAQIDIETCPFRPRLIRLYVDAGAALEIGFKTDEMAGDAYLATTGGSDTGVTINSDGFTVANGANINVASVTTYFECEG